VTPTRLSVVCVCHVRRLRALSRRENCTHTAEGAPGGAARGATPSGGHSTQQYGSAPRCIPTTWGGYTVAIPPTWRAFTVTPARLSAVCV